MKRLLAIWLALVSTGWAALDFTATIDYAYESVPTYTVYQASERSWVWTVRNYSATQDITGQTPFMYWATSNSAGSVVTARCAIVVATSGTFRATFTPTDLNYTGRVVYGVGLVGTNGNAVVARQGTLVIVADPYASGAGAITYTTPLNWGLYTFSGQSNMPLVISGATYVTNASGQVVATVTGALSAAESDPVFIAATGTIWAGINAASTTGTAAHLLALQAHANASGRVAKAGDTMAGALTFSDTNGITISKAYTPIELGTQWDGFYTNAPWRIHTSNFKGPWNDFHILYNARNYPDASGTIENWTNRDVNGLSSICMDITPNYSNAAGEWVLWQFRTAVKDTGAPVWVDSFGAYISTTNQTNAIAYWRGAMAFGAANPGGVAGYQATFYTDAVRTSAAYFAGTVRLQDTYASTEAGSVYNRKNRDSTAKDIADWYTLQGTNRWLVGMGPTIAGESRYGWTRWNGSAWVNAGHFDDAGKLILSNGLQAAGIATGTPLYVESDPVFAATQGYYRVWGAGVTQTPTGAVITAGGSMDYAAVEGASNLALAAYGLATNAALAAGAAGVDATQALVRVQGLGVVVSNIVTYAPTNAATPLTINVANSTTATVTRAPGMHHVRINLTNAVNYAGPLAGGWSDGEAGNVMVWFYGTGSVSGVGISLTNMAGKLMATNSVGAVWSKPPAGAWENLPLK